jgi:hypothetical protein
MSNLTVVHYFQMVLTVNASITAHICIICFTLHVDHILIILYGCETWSLTLREEHRLGVFENRVLRIFGPRGMKKWENEERCTMGSFIICTHHQILLGKSNQGE